MMVWEGRGAMFEACLLILVWHGDSMEGCGFMLALKSADGKGYR